MAPPIPHSPEPDARAVGRSLMWLFAKGIIFPGALTIALCFLALELRLDQWWKMLPLIPLGVAFYTLPEAWLVRRLYHPLGVALVMLDHQRAPAPGTVSRALVRALNLPYYTFLRITLVRGCKS